MGDKGGLGIIGKMGLLQHVMPLKDSAVCNSFCDEYVNSFCDEYVNSFCDEYVIASSAERPGGNVIVPRNDIISLGLTVPYYSNIGAGYDFHIQMVPVNLQNIKQVSESKRPLYVLDELSYKLPSLFGTRFLPSGEEDVWKFREAVTATFKIVKDYSSYGNFSWDAGVNLSWGDGKPMKELLEGLVENTGLASPVFLARVVGLTSFSDRFKEIKREPHSLNNSKASSSIK